MVSIIIPVYNTRLDDLQRCIASVLAQSVDDLEILIIENGSREDCARAVDEIAASDERIKVFHRQNEGVSVARNFGTEQAAGDYVLYVDADDLLEKTAVEDGLRAAEAIGCDVVIGKIDKTAVLLDTPVDTKPNGGYTLLDTREKRDAFRAHIFTKADPAYRFEDGTLFNGEGCWAHLIKRETALKLKFPEGVAVGEDTIWALDMIDKGISICLSDKLWYYYIQNDYSVLSKYNPHIVEQLTQPVERLSPVYLNAEAPIYCAYMRWILSKLKQISYRYFLAAENTASNREKRREFKNMISASPWKETLRGRSCLSLKVRLRLFLYRHYLMLTVFRFKK